MKSLFRNIFTSNEYTGTPTTQFDNTISQGPFVLSKDRKTVKTTSDSPCLVLIDHDIKEGERFDIRVDKEEEGYFVITITEATPDTRWSVGAVTYSPDGLITLWKGPWNPLRNPSSGITYSVGDVIGAQLIDGAIQFFCNGQSSGKPVQPFCRKPWRFGWSTDGPGSQVTLVAKKQEEKPPQKQIHDLQCTNPSVLEDKIKFLEAENDRLLSLNIKLQQTINNLESQVAKLSKVNDPEEETTPPWLFPKILFNSSSWKEKSGYKVIEMTPENEWGEYSGVYSNINALWNKYGQNPYKIKKIAAVSNMRMQQVWERTGESLNKRSQRPEFQPQWEREQYMKRRKAILKRMENMIIGKEGNMKIIPVFHGTKEQNVESICESGFANLATLDPGFFGKGVYGTPQAEYAARFYGFGVCFLCFVYVLNAFPVVIEDDFLGARNHANFDVHFVPVKPKTTYEMDSTYVATGENDIPVYDEIVVFQDVQIIPRYIIYY